MAAAFAYEPPSIEKAWQAFCAHLPTIALIWTANIVVAIIGVVLNQMVQWIGAGIAGFGDGRESVVLMAISFGLLMQMPFVILGNLAHVLFIAVPAEYYERGMVITPGQAISLLMKRPLRYLLAGILFSMAMLLGFIFCYFPGLIIAFVMPIYVNRIFLTDQSIPAAFAASFQAVYRSPNGLSFVGIQLLAWIVVAIVTVCTCGLAGLAALPMSNFYIQNVAYSKGLVR